MEGLQNSTVELLNLSTQIMNNFSKVQQKQKII
jgi:hypothetical protein